MAGSLGSTSTADPNEYSALIASDETLQREITLSSASGSLSRGTVLALNTTTLKWEQVDAGGATGTTVARAVLIDLTAGSDTREEKAQAYFVAKFNYDALIWPTGATRHQIDVFILALEDRGSVIDRGFSSGLTTTTTTSTTTTSSSSTSSTSSSTTTTTTVAS